jgi:hypothetical protein
MAYLAELIIPASRSSTVSSQLVKVLLTDRMLLGHVIVRAAHTTDNTSGGVNTQMNCPMGPQLSPILVGERTEVTGGGRRLGDGGFLFDLRLDGSGLVLDSDIFFFGRDMLGLDTLNLFVNETGLALDRDDGGRGVGLRFLFDSSRSRGTRRRGGVERELQRHLVLSHSTESKHVSSGPIGCADWVESRECYCRTTYTKDDESVMVQKEERKIW